jgi:hypothetical protein
MISTRILAPFRHLPTASLIHTFTMPATIVKVPTIESLHEVANKAVEEHKGKDVYVYYYASIDPNSGKSWCPDCVAGMPTLFRISFWAIFLGLSLTKAFL